MEKQYFICKFKTTAAQNKPTIEGTTLQYPRNHSLLNLAQKIETLVFIK